MRRTIKVLLAVAAILAALCSASWEEDVAVSASTKEWTDGNNYIVNGNVAIGDRIEVKGSVTLTLSEGCEVCANSGISVPMGSSLTINGTGSLFAKCSDEAPIAAIGGYRDGSCGESRTLLAFT